MSRPVIICEVGDHELTIVDSDGKQLIIIGVTADGSQLQVAMPGIDDVVLCGEDRLTEPAEVAIKARKVGPRPTFTEPEQVQPIRAQEPDIDRVIQDIKDDVEPSWRRPTPASVAAAGHVIQRQSATSGLSDEERDDIILQVLDSWVDHPRQDAKYTAAESHRIALDVFGQDTHHTVMRVAGVRAALTRGAYELSMADLIRQRMRERSREESTSAD